MSRLQRTVPSLALAALAIYSPVAMAQSAYTMTVLGKPSGAFSFAPTTLDDQGLVRGGMYYASGVKFVAVYPFGAFVKAYLYQAVSWSGTTATATAALGGKYLFPNLTNNNSGVQVGPYTQTSELQNTLLPEVFPPHSSTVAPVLTHPRRVPQRCCDKARPTPTCPRCWPKAWARPTPAVLKACLLPRA